MIVVNRLAKQPDNIYGARDLARYLAAPTGYGKTSLILPVFLRSTKRKDLIGFSHYIYIAFENNASGTFSFSSHLNKDNALAENQGAFIVKCVETILTNQTGRDINVDMDDDTLAMYSPKEKLRELISKLSSGDRKAKVLFHVDEHRKMCPRTNEENDPGASFSKGAMETLAAYGTVVATYTDKPDYLSPIGTYPVPVCRYPIGLPPIDIENLMKEYKLKDDNHYHPFQFPFDKKILDREGKRLLATLKFKLAVKCTSYHNKMAHGTLSW